MDPELARAIQAIESVKKFKHDWTPGQPASQPYFGYADGEWKEVTAPATSQGPSSFTVLSWNIDFMRMLGSVRMKAALSHLKALTESINKPSIIMLNEMVKGDLELIQAEEWVRSDYHVSDLSDKYWESGYYGTCIIIPKVLSVKHVFRLHYEKTNMERDALFVDIDVHGKTLRICSTHLESLVANPPLRPGQLAAAAKFMHEADASILGGDLNAIQPFDKTLHSDNGLKDAYLEMGGVEDAASGMTWGQMAPRHSRDRFGLSRMDKLLFCGEVGVSKFETFGLDVEVESPEDRAQLIQSSNIEKGWVTDHLGIMADFHIILPDKL